MNRDVPFVDPIDGAYPNRVLSRQSFERIALIAVGEAQHIAGFDARASRDRIRLRQAYDADIASILRQLHAQPMLNGLPLHPALRRIAVDQDAQDRQQRPQPACERETDEKGTNHGNNDDLPVRRQVSAGAPKIGGPLALVALLF